MMKIGGNGNLLKDEVDKMCVSVCIFGISLLIILACVIVIIYLALERKEFERVYILMKNELGELRK